MIKIRKPWKLFLLVLTGGLSMFLTAGFFASLGTDLVSFLALGAVGIAFEGLKLDAWDKVRRHQWGYLGVAVPCTVLSLVSSCAFASLTLERGWASSAVAVEETQRTSMIEQSLVEERTAYLTMLKSLPTVGYTISAERVRGLLASNREEQKKLSEKAKPTETPENTASLALSLAKRFGMDGPFLITLLLILIAIVLEAGVTILVFEVDFRFHKGEPEPENPLDEFLVAIVNGKGKVLSRRYMLDLGWTERQVRKYTAELKEKGILVQKGRGNSLQLGPNYCKLE